MKKKIFRWLKFIGLLAAAAVCLCMILLELIFVVPEYGAWQFNASVKQLYEDMDSFFIGVSFLILCSVFFSDFRKRDRPPFSEIGTSTRSYLAAESELHSLHLAHPVCGIHAVGPGCYRKDGCDHRGRRSPHGL